MSYRPGPYRPAKERPGKAAWLGPASLGLGLISWAIPVVGILLAVGAVACAVVSIATKAQYRTDWTAVAGLCVALGQMLFSLLVLAGDTQH